MSTTYTLTQDEATIYDGVDDDKTRNLFRSLRARFGREDIVGITTTVLHPDGYVIAHFSDRAWETA